MSTIAKLKKKATDLENKKQYDKALEVYLDVLRQSKGTDEERDAPLFNRVGDLFMRIGKVEQALTYYEQAVDLYADSGFLNNAIALCNKILRHAPGRNIIYYKLGQISAKKGFNSDAKQNFLEYADRMQKSGALDEAFRALQEFADLCPGQEDVRLMLAEQLTRAERTSEALEQLQILHETFEAEGRRSEAAATLQRMQNLDPMVQPRSMKTPRLQKSDGLVFLDVSFGDDIPAPSGTFTPPAAKLEGLELTSLSDEGPPRRERGREEPAAPGSPDRSLDTGAPRPAEGVPEETGIESAPDTASAPDTVIPLEVPDSVASPDGEPLDGGPDAGMRFDESAISGLQSTREDASSVTFDVPPQREPDLEPTAVAPEPLPADLPFILDTQPVGDVGDAGSTGLDDDFVDLGAWLKEDEAPRSTRMVSRDDKRVGEEQADFADMLAKFKQGVAANVEEEDFDSHYDLGVAYREMGLLDEAISEFQKAVRGRTQKVRAYEAMGQCFIDKEEFVVAATVLQRALTDPQMAPSVVGEHSLIGILYLMGVAAESQGKWSEAAELYQRVMAVDIEFRDVRERLAAVSETAR